MIVWKMHGCGNDFCVVNYKEGIDYSKLAKRICNRNIGVGSDGLVIVKENPLEMIFYNADGSRAPMCGNGIRCFARYCYEHNLTRRNKLEVLTLAGKMVIEITSTEPFICKVNMGSPIFNNPSINVSDNLDSFGRVLNINDLNVTVYSFFMGTVHTVIFVNDFKSEVVSYAEQICFNKIYTKQTNVNFVQIIDKSHIKVMTFERGVGWTLACGTGCTAAVVASSRLGLTGKNVDVELELGHLQIEVKKDAVYMSGPAEKVFECEYKEEI